MSTTPPTELPRASYNAIAGPSTPPSYPPTPSKPMMSHGRAAAVDDGISNPPLAPARSAADYVSDDEEDGDEAQELVYVSAAPVTPHKLQSQRIHHQKDSSRSELITDIPPGTPASPQTVARQRMLRSYEDDGIRDSPIQRLRACYIYITGLIKRNEGFLLIGLAQACMAGINTCVKVLTRIWPCPVWQILVIRMSVTWFGCYTYMKWAGIEHPLLGPPGVRFLLLVRGVVGFFGVSPMYYSLMYLSLSDATVLPFLAPVIVGVLASLLLKEPFTRTEAMAGIMSFLGTLLIAKPSFLFPSIGPPLLGPGGVPVTPEQRATAVGVALIGAFGAAGAYLCIRKIGKRASALHSISYFAAWTVVCAISYAIIFKSPPLFFLDIRFIGLITPIGVLGFVGQALLTLGFQKEKAGRGALGVYSNLLFAMILEKVVFNKLPDAWSILGSGIIIGGAVWVALTKEQQIVVGDPAAANTAAGSLNDYSAHNASMAKSDGSSKRGDGDRRVEKEGLNLKRTSRDSDFSNDDTSIFISIDGDHQPRRPSLHGPATSDRSN